MNSNSKSIINDGNRYTYILFQYNNILFIFGYIFRVLKYTLRIKFKFKYLKRDSFIIYKIRFLFGVFFIYIRFYILLIREILELISPLKIIKIKKIFEN